ncbi:MAG TPA: hypothetical protein VF678_05840, partial [bacterium]
MTGIVSVEQQFFGKLQPFRYDPAAGIDDEAQLRGALADLPALPHLNGDSDAKALLAVLNTREKQVKAAIGAHHARRMKEMVRANLTAPHAFEILFQRARLIDALHRLAFRIAMEDLPALVALRRADAEKELEFKQAVVPKKKEKLVHFRAHLPSILAEEGSDAAKLAYFSKIGADLEKEVADAELAVATLAAQLPAWRDYKIDAQEVQRRVALFARGGYGRAELSFASD